MAQTYKFGNGTWARKKGSTLAYSDTNNAFKPLPFSFERNSIATRVNKEGLIEVVGNDIPRIDYTDSTEGALLLENSSTNLVTYSEDFSQSTSYQDYNSTILLNQSVSPNGSNNASSLTPSNTNTFHAIAINKPTVIGQNPMFSIFIKPNGYNFVQLVGGLGYNTTSDYWINFDIENKIIASKGSAFNGNFDIIELNNGYVRISAEIEVTSSNSGGQILLLPLFSNIQSRLPSYIGNGSSVYIWGAMLEANSVASSYIPTNGSTVQRAAETCNGSGNSEVFNDSQGVLFADISALVESSPARVISIGEGLNYENGIIMSFDTSDNLIKYRVRSNNITTVDLSVSNVNRASNHKICLKYKVNDFALWIDGFKVDYVLSGAVPLSLSKIQFSDMNVIGAPFYGKTKEIAYYDEILTDLELETLTSYRSLNEMVTELNLNAL